MFFVSRRIFCGAVTALPALATHAAGPATPAAGGDPLLTILEGEAFLLRDSSRFALAEGVTLKADDMLEVPEASGLLRLELSDGTSLAIGPGSRAQVAPRLAGERGGARLYLLAGWLKVTASREGRVTVLSPAFDLSTSGGSMVLSVQADASRVFAESGETNLRRSGAAPQTLKAGEWLTLATGAGARPELVNRPTQAFVSTLPRAFMDALPSRAARFRDKPVEPRRLAAIDYAEAQPWLDAEPALRKANLPRWRPLARDAEFRRGLSAGLKAHPEWAPILSPPEGKRPPH